MKLFSLKSKLGKIILSLLVITTIFITSSLFNHTNRQDNRIHQDSIRHIETKSNVKIFDLNQNFSHIELYEKIKCNLVRSSYATTTICLHDLKDDIFVSASLARGDPWEKGLLDQFMKYAFNNPESLIIDIGAHVGQYSLFAAKLGRKVLTIEPFYPNILRIHKAISIEKAQTKITLIQNAVSNKRNELKKLYKNQKNVGGQSLYPNKDDTFIKDAKDVYLVETILLDDIIDHIPLRNVERKEKFQKAIIKIDIEGFEPFAFEHAQELFAYLDIEIVFMEWMNLPLLTKEYARIESMIKFFTNRNYRPFDESVLLDLNKWNNSWPGDILWKKVK